MQAASTGRIAATLTLGGGATGWTATKSNDDSDAFITNFTASGGGTTVLDIDYSANAGTTERSATINITPTGAGSATGTVFSLVITQLGTAATITVGSVTDADDTTITPTGTTYEVDASAQTLTVPIELTAPAVNVSYTSVPDLASSFLTSVTLQTSPLRYEIVYDANAGAERSVTLTFEALDGSDASFVPPVTTEITITQAEAIPTITVGEVTDADDTTITPTGTNYEVDASAQTLTVPIELTAPAVNVSYTSVPDLASSFLTSVTLQTSPLRYEIVYDANTGAERSVTLTFEALDGSDASFTPAVTTEITITQAEAAASPTITVGEVTDADDTTITPTGTTYSVPATAQTLTVPIELTAPAVECVVYFCPGSGILFSYERNVANVPIKV